MLAGVMSMHRGIALLTALCLAGCASTGNYCRVDEQHRSEILENIAPVLEDLESETIRYIPSKSLSRDGVLYRDEGGCFIYIGPQSKREGHGVLDGDGGIYIDMETFQSKEVFWYQY